MTHAFPTVKLSPAMAEDEVALWQSVFAAGEHRYWNEGETVYRPGDISKGIHFCISGTFRTTSFSLSGKQRTLWLMRSNSIMGEIAMLTDSRTIYFMECQEGGETVFFTRKKLIEKIFPACPDLSLSIMRILATKLRMQSEDVQAFNFMPAWQRVGVFLLERYWEEKRPICMSHARIAEFLGLHRVTVTNAIALLRNNGFIEYSEKNICLTDPTGLESYLRSCIQ